LKGGLIVIHGLAERSLVFTQGLPKVDARTIDIVGKVVESTPPRRLVLTWARPNDAEDESKHSRVTFDIEPYGDSLVRLTVTHDDLERDPQMLKGVSGGWPVVLSNLKTFLETGRALPTS
jgi:uncharacterized protein YndB with AHSA1/START domain